MGKAKRARFLSLFSETRAGARELVQNFRLFLEHQREAI